MPATLYMPGIEPSAGYRQQRLSLPPTTSGNTRKKSSVTESPTYLPIFYSVEGDLRPTPEHAGLQPNPMPATLEWTDGLRAMRTLPIGYSQNSRLPPHIGVCSTAMLLPLHAQNNAAMSTICPLTG